MPEGELTELEIQAVERMGDVCGYDYSPLLPLFATDAEFLYDNSGDCVAIAVSDELSDAMTDAKKKPLAHRRTPEEIAEADEKADEKYHEAIARLGREPKYDEHHCVDGRLVIIMVKPYEEEYWEILFRPMTRNTPVDHSEQDDTPEISLQAAVGICREIKRLGFDFQASSSDGCDELKLSFRTRQAVEDFIRLMGAVPNATDGCDEVEATEIGADEYRWFVLFHANELYRALGVLKVKETRDGATKKPQSTSC